MKEFEHLKIQLEELEKATNNFSSKVIGTGGFGKVYEGEVSHSRGRSMVAIKRLNREYGQGDPEFWKEVMMLSRYTHKNLISLLGFCDEDDEKILVYEHASNGSLDHHLSSTILTWTQRLNICLDVAKGLRYLHDHKGTQQRVLHRDIKSANILLDDNWNAKLSDMGLSKVGPANQRHTFLFTNVVGTPGYCDPQYMETYTLTKESDIYSLGVLFFEVLCGRLCFNYTQGKLEILVPTWKQSYIHKKLHQIIFNDLTPSIELSSLETFSDIAFQCLHYSREERPSISLLVKKLENALEFQKLLNMNFANVVGTPEEYRHVNQPSVLFFKPGKRKREEAKQNEAEGRGGKAAIAGKGAVQPQSGLEVGELVHFDGTIDFTADDLLNATTERTRKSTYGSDYKITLENGDEVVIKEFREGVAKSHIEFKVELNLLRKINHLNLLVARAYYLGPRGDKLLVFNYMPNGSLADYFHARRPETRVYWAVRMHIAKGVARGLHSLHTHHNIIHGNLTSHNVLLDENINPKISNFELLRLTTIAAKSNMIAEARILGYQAPEVFNIKEVDMKTDVYSLGVIMLELLTGKSPGKSNSLCLPQMVALIMKKGGDSTVFDPELMKDASKVGDNELLNTLKLALKCVHPSPKNRPDAQLVLQRLEEIRPETTTTDIGDDGGFGPSLSK